MNIYILLYYAVYLNAGKFLDIASRPHPFILTLASSTFKFSKMILLDNIHTALIAFMLNVMISKIYFLITANLFNIPMMHTLSDYVGKTCLGKGRPRQL